VWIISVFIVVVKKGKRTTRGDVRVSPNNIESRRGHYHVL
jgi:hypothetical protein